MTAKDFLITFEGVDQSGKKTQASMLASRLKTEGYAVESIAFPDYSTPIGVEIQAFLRGERDYPPLIRQILYTANRLERSKDIEGWLKENRIVIADRYSQSGLVYGYVNGLNLGWMMDLERGLPKADLVVVVDVPIDVAFRRKADRDIYERNMDFMNKIRQAYLELANRFGWIVINGNRFVSEVHEDVWAIVTEKLRTQ